MFPTLFSLGPITVGSYGVFLVLAFLLGSFVFWKKAREEHYEESEIFDLSLVCTFWALVGARLSYIFFHFSDYGLNLVYWFSLWSRPGLHWIGLFAGGLWAFTAFVKRKKWDLFKTFDLAVIGLSLAQATVNLGLFFGGGSVGKVTGLPWGVVYPGTLEKRHPVALYGFLLWLGMFVFLWWVEGKYRRFDWYQRFRGDSKSGFLLHVYVMSLGLFGGVLSLLTEPSLLFLQIDVDLALRITLLLAGFFGLLSRSGLALKLGFNVYKSRAKIGR